SDIDIFCYNRKEFAKQILNFGNKYLNKGFEIEVKDIGNNHTFVDFYQNDEIYFRFDLYDSFPNHKKIKIKKYYLYSVIENAVRIIKKYNEVEYYIFVPSKIDDLLLRYIEYIEWYELRPDKVKHLDYILDKLSEDSSKMKFIDKLHLYTKFPELGFNDYPNSFSQKRNISKIGFFKKLRKFLGKFYFIRKIYFKIHKRNKN
ncbi:MAG: hypothetical protein ACTSQG_07940, partial [Promethearchaeota archaeon]